MSLSPWPFFMDFKGIVPKALTPNFICPISSESRIQPYINTPAQLFLTAIAARLSPNMPHLNEPPASTTRTWKGNETQKMRTTVVINSVTDPGEGPTPAPFIFRPNWGLKSQKKCFWRPPVFDLRWYMFFIWHQTLACQWDVLLINTTHGNNERPEKTRLCIISYCFIWEDMSKTQASCFITGSKHLETEESNWLQASCFHLFLGVWSLWWTTRLT